MVSPGDFYFIALSQNNNIDIYPKGVYKEINTPLGYRRNSMELEKECCSGKTKDRNESEKRDLLNRLKQINELSK